MSTNDDRAIDRCCDAFEEKFAAGEADPLNLVESVEESLRGRLLIELIRLESELDSDFSASRRRSWYLGQFNAYQSAVEEAFSIIEQIKADTAITEVSESESDTPVEIENYRLMHVIGEGGMGVVWLAEEQEPVRRLVAVKIIRPGMASQEVMARFDAERQALAMMDHPGIARIYHAGTTTSRQPYFVMEFVQGVPLNEYCDDKALSIRSRLELFSQVCEAVQHAHQKGIIHRDLKPSNVIVTEYDGKPQPKVIDFGLAKALDAGKKLTDRTLQTEFGQVLGTLRYMSPEQASLDSLDVDTRSDVYSLGAILHELLTGATPLSTDSIRGAALLTVLKFVREADTPKPSQRWSTMAMPLKESLASTRNSDARSVGLLLSGDLDWLVMKSLEKDRNRRYASAGDLALDVKRFLADEAIEARPPSTGYLLAKFWKRHRLAVTSAVLVLVSLVGGLAGTIVFAVQAEEARQKAETALANERAVSLELLSLSEQLGDVYLDTGDRMQALKLFESALEKSMELLGPDNPTTLEQQHSIAYLYGLDGRLTEALPILKQNAEAVVRVLGEAAPETHSAISNYAATLLRLGDTQRATAEFNRVYRLRLKYLDQDDFGLRISRRWMVICYSMLGRWQEALPIAESWVAELDRNGEKESPEYAWAVTSLAAIKFGIEDFEQSIIDASNAISHPGRANADLFRARNVLSAARLRLASGNDAQNDAAAALESSYAELKLLIDELPGFKQFFIVNACQRTLAEFRRLGDSEKVKFYEQELIGLERYLEEQRKPVHPGIPTYDPKTGTETERHPSSPTIVRPTDSAPN